MGGKAKEWGEGRKEEVREGRWWVPGQQSCVQNAAGAPNSKTTLLVSSSTPRAFCATLQFSKRRPYIGHNINL